MHSLPLLFAVKEADEKIILPILIFLIIIIVTARVFAILFRWIGQPNVVGEIAAGLILGPSVFGKLFPEAFQAVFRNSDWPVPPETLSLVLTTLSQLGLVLLLFLIGLEFDFDHLRWHGPAAASVSLSGLILPFFLGVALTPIILPATDPEGTISPLNFALFMGTAMSITAIPILGRIMMELNIHRTRLGAMTITAAACDDAAGWILLATVAAIVQSAFSPGKLLTMIGLTVGFALFMLFVLRPLLVPLLRWIIRQGNGDLGLNGLALVFVVLFLCAIATNLIGIFAIFGAFFLGAVLSGEKDFREAVSRKLTDFVSAFFLPIFFTYTGLRTDIGTLGSSGYLWFLCGLVILAAVVGKFGGCTLAARFSGQNWRESTCIGIMMNTRALMELIVINKGKDLGVIPDSVFCMLVLMALITTVMTTPILLLAMRGTELETLVNQSSFGSSVAVSRNIPMKQQVPS